MAEYIEGVLRIVRSLQARNSSTISIRPLETGMQRSLGPCQYVLPPDPGDVNGA